MTTQTVTVEARSDDAGNTYAVRQGGTWLGTVRRLSWKGWHAVNRDGAHVTVAATRDDALRALLGPGVTVRVTVDSWAGVTEQATAVL